MKRVLVYTCCFLMLCGFFWEKPKTYGESVPEGTTATVAQVLTNAKDYEGKDVTLEGKILRECGSGCWLDLQEDTAVVYVDLNPSQFAIPQKVGKKARITGTVKVRDGKPMIMGKGVEV